MFKALSELFREQPHLVFITIMVLLLSFSGAAYLLGDWLLRRRRNSNVLELAIASQQFHSASVADQQMRRIPVAGKPRYVRTPRRVVPTRVEHIPDPLRNQRVQEHSSPKPAIQPHNPLKDAVNLMVDADALPRKRIRPTPKPVTGSKIPSPEQQRLPEETIHVVNEDKNLLKDAVNQVIDLNVPPKKTRIHSTEKLVVPAEKKELPPVVNVMVTIAGMTPAESNSGHVTVETRTLFQEETQKREVLELAPKPKVNVTAPVAKVVEMEVVKEDVPEIEISSLDTISDTIEAPIIEPQAVNEEPFIGNDPAAFALNYSREENIVPEVQDNNQHESLQLVTEDDDIIEHGESETFSLAETPVVEEAVTELYDSPLPGIPGGNSESDLRFIGYQPHDKFAQPEQWKYPYVTMPWPGSVVWTPKPLRLRLSRNAIEEMFQLEMRRTFPAFEIAGDDCIPDPLGNKPYEPDISLIVKGLGLNLFIDVEIDGPNYSGEDYKSRDGWFNNRGWIVIRLSEEQVKNQPKHCLAFIARVIHSVYPEYHIPTHLKKLDGPNPEDFG